jgi:2-oxoglutarate ferredoxin oxidoreductase subunit alpha
MSFQTPGISLIDGSRLIVEACVRAGADVYVGYPITPANLIYTYSSQLFSSLLPAPDEISALQWIAGLSAAGCLPVTATSFPGFALMLESLNMAFMMELPMLVVLAQRLGPSTGTATAGAQGDLRLLHGMISGGYPLPVLCISDLNDCWNLPPVALQVAVDLRTPVVLLTSKEMVMTQASFDLASLGEIHPVKREYYTGQGEYSSYAAGANQTPSFLPVGNDAHQVRLNASTHNAQGILHHTSPESLENTRRLQTKIETGTPVLYYLDEQAKAKTLVVSYGISSGAGREAVVRLREMGKAVSLLVARTMFPIPDIYSTIMDRYPRVVFVEENLQGQYARLLCGERLPTKAHLVSGIGKMIQPEQIIQAVSMS